MKKYVTGLRTAAPDHVRTAVGTPLCGRGLDDAACSPMSTVIRAACMPAGDSNDVLRRVLACRRVLGDAADAAAAAAAARHGSAL